MSKSLNQVFLIGGVGKDPEFKSLPSGTSAVTFTLATTESHKEEDKWVETAEWHNIVAYGRTAEVVRDHVVKGSKVHIDGKIKTRSWEDKTTGEKKYRTEVIANEVIFMSRGEKKEPEPESF